MPEYQRTCNHCGRPIANGGPRSATGLYYCQREECRAAKQRDYYARRHGGRDRPMAPERCLSCGMALKPRKQRIDDIPGKRWCNKPPCRLHRAAEIKGDGQVGSLEQLLARAERRLAFLQKAAYPNEKVECPECGIPDAVEGYVHPNYDRQRCEALGVVALDIQDARSVWPGLMGPPEWKLAQIRDKGGATIDPDDD